MFLQGDTESELGDPIWLCRIMHNTVYYKFQKKTLWLAHKCVELDGIILYVRDIALKIQLYEHITGIC